MLVLQHNYYYLQACRKEHENNIYRLLEGKKIEKKANKKRTSLLDERHKNFSLNEGILKVSIKESERKLRKSIFLLHYRFAHLHSADAALF